MLLKHARPVLSMHDGMICKASDAGLLEQLVLEHCERIIGQRVELKREY